MLSRLLNLSGLYLGPQVLLLYCSPDLEIIDQVRSLRTPTGLYFLAAYLNSNGISVKIDNFSGLSRAECADRLRSYRPAYIGLSMLTINRLATMELARLIKEVLPETKIFIGGPHATFLPKEILLRTPEIDCVVCGEGEETLLELIRCWEEKDDMRLVNGVVYRENGRIIHNKARPFIKDLSGLPHPAERFVYDHLNTSRGCPFTCGFCSSSHFWGRSIRFHSPEWVVDEIELLYKRHGIREFSFNDDVFTMEKKRVISICRKIMERGLFVRFRSMSRVNTICTERLEWLKRAGCYRIDFGVESGSPRILKAMGKRATAEQAREAFRMTREAGIETGCFLIVGFPGEDDRSIEETKQLVRKLRPNFCDISNMAIFPNSPVYLKLVRENRISPDIWFRMREHTLFLVEEGKREKYEQDVKELKALFESNKKRYDFSIHEREAILELYGGLGHAALDLSRALVEQNEPSRALQVLIQAVSQEPQNPFLWYHMAELCLRLNDPALGLETIEKAVDLQPKNYESRLLASKIAEKLNKPEKALDELELAISFRPDRIEAYIERGDILSRMKKWAEASESYFSALRIDPYWRPIKTAIRQCQHQMDRARHLSIEPSPP